MDAAAKGTPPPTPVSSAPPDAGLDPLGKVLFAALAPAIERSVTSRLDDVAKVVREAREAFTLALAEAKAGTSKIEWRVNGEVFAKVEGAHHKALPEILRKINAGIRNFLLVGPAGSGKTHLAADVAKALSRDFASVSCTVGMPEWHLVGRSTPNLTTGDSRYAPSQFVHLYELGGVFLADEFDASDPNTVLVLNSSLANGHLDVPARTENPIAKRHANFIFLAAANTYGNGADRQYVGRNQLDASTKSRFAGGILFTDYDRDLETALIGDAQILARVWGVREKAAALGLRQIVGTRELIAVTRLVKAGGYSLDEALRDLTVHWTADERTKAGVC